MGWVGEGGTAEAEDERVVRRWQKRCTHASQSRACLAIANWKEYTVDVRYYFLLVNYVDISECVIFDEHDKPQLADRSFTSMEDNWGAESLKSIFKKEQFFQVTNIQNL